VKTDLSVAETLRSGCGSVWEGLHEHPFVLELAAGTLPPEKFRFYVEQNLQYLVEYARAMALGASHADDEKTMRMFAAELRNVLENELPQNRELLRQVIELGAPDLGGAEGMAPATIAYTGFLVATAGRASPLEVLTALLPCAWSYGEIAARLVPEAGDHPVYAEWIRFFASEEYGAVVDQMREDFEGRAAAADGSLLERLQHLFTTGARLEHGFWEMAYRLEHWPDVRARYPLE
jgi:thiaminase (transcriptional activator TenA)